ncbi:pre-rRNA-processing protein TSR2 homolog [Oppia nitens]|uniref:pre-rRNA-processing protein TSR2 homolog n=1 Tax=Oppia nitens TaxID=1686743 RepID=UPI0023DC1028|nr:pre-rRNA-processing protein TSR2 homolog [Oppia nitens]
MSSTTTADEVFSLAIETSMMAWKSFQLSIEHGMGGQYQREKLVWMKQTIEDVFRQNSGGNGGLHADELEEYVGEILDNEFNTVIEDGSLGIFASNVCQFYRMCADGQHRQVMDSVDDMRRKANSGVVVGNTCPQAISEDMMVGVVENGLNSLDIEDNDEDDDEEVVESDSRVVVVAEDMKTTEEAKEEEEEDDGWTRVQRKGHNKR